MFDWHGLKCLALGPFCDSYIARFFSFGEPRVLDSVGVFTKGESRALPGAEALFGLNRA